MVWCPSTLYVSTFNSVLQIETLVSGMNKQISGQFSVTNVMISFIQNLILLREITTF